MTYNVPMMTQSKFMHIAFGKSLLINIKLRESLYREFEMPKQQLKQFLILIGTAVARKCDNVFDASLFADHFACACVRKFSCFTLQDEIDISDAIWSASSPEAQIVTILADFC